MDGENTGPIEPAARDALIETQFPLEEDLVYLNHAALGPWPRRTAEAIAEFAHENLTEASRNWRDWYATEQRLRRRLGRLINVEQADISLLKNTSEALSIVAMGLDWRAGDNVVLAACEFPSNRQPWEACANLGVSMRQVQAPPGPHFHRALIEACDERTRVVTVSSVQYASGVRVDLASLGDFCARAGILFGVDAIQSLGALRLDAAAIEADFVAAGAHKWMLAPEGIAFLYTRPALRARLRLNQYGWRMGERPFDYETANAGPAADGRRFEPGTLNTLGIIGLDASLSLYEELGADFVQSRVLENSAFLIRELAALGVEIVTPLEPGAHAGIVSLRAETPERTRELYRSLRAGGVLSAMRGGNLRLSPHYHNSTAQLGATVQRLGETLRRR